jgi:hypothetical protein
MCSVFPAPAHQSIYHDFKFHLSSDVTLGLKVFVSRARLPLSVWDRWEGDEVGFSQALVSPPDATYVTVQVCTDL